MTEPKIVTGLKEAVAYAAQRIYGDISRGEALSLFTQLANGYTLCHDRRYAEAVIIERASAYRRNEYPEAVIPLSGCDFTGEIGNIILALSARCYAAEEARDKAHETIRELTRKTPGE